MSNPILTCAEVHPLLPEHLLDELSAEVAAHVQGHLASCARCAREWEELTAVDEFLTTDAGPTTAELAEARLGLRRSLQEAPAPARWTWQWRGFAMKAAGFLLTIGLLTPLADVWSPELEQATETSVLRPKWEDGMQSFKERLRPWVPSWSPSEWFVEMHDPSSDLLDGLPTLHSESLYEDRRSG